MNLKQFLPLENYTLTTKLSAEEVRDRIANKTGPKKNFRFSLEANSYTKPYEGVLTNSSFTICRVIDYRNSFLPVITGNISSYAGKTEVKISMQLQKFVLIFVSVWLSLVGIAFVMQFLYFLNTSPKTFSMPLLISFGSMIFLWVLTYFAFKKESKISKGFLARLLEGEEIAS
ncbi:hypothetical protein [Ferruginibacter sp.]|nr:hypothetical protein [Ferruginibacter sp.]